MLEARACLAGAYLVLTGARMLQRIGVIGPARFTTALSWSDCLTRRGMAAWRRNGR